MISRSPSLLQIEAAAADQGMTPRMQASGELVGLRLIIQASPRQCQHRPPLAVLRRSSVRSSPASGASKCQETLGGPRFMGLEFLKLCLCCCRKIDGDMDVFVYKGEQAFCSAECRSQHIAREERREIEILVRKRRDAFHSRRAAPGKTIRGSSDRHARVEISSFC
ncbi:FCS-Like Zinc finger 17-like [Lolium rigidum]|uniref:FCS-Like Zinc finger 17-like n=1 Tax=Lolium rigidum TaxID=89674 RepID=UPI001F5CF61F|nr:FCS-Like Zinc finger 17-like [Lolium rigidum]